MSKHKLIPYPVIAAAVRGDPEAVNRVLDHYSGYIAALSMRRGYDQNGNPCLDRKSTRLNSSHDRQSRMPSSA